MKKTLERNFHDLGLGQEFLDMTQKACSLKENIDILNFTKLNTFWLVKVTVKRMKELATVLVKIFANTYPTLRIYKEPSKGNSKKTTQLKLGKRFEQIF